MTAKPGRPLLKWLFVIFAGLYVLALGLLLVGTYGWFGQEQDPLSGVFLLPLGLPWNLLADALGLQGAALMAAAPMVNAAILFWLSKR
ncbi:hypothetical protein OZN62_08405 [Aurantiacibacter sp. MUD11]|uniref:hypothetical protein n=1 Tax=Aurantiacibacter sp. MUD11 TaxID=3003265 RepID=UPI0022A9FBCF|nr:hypothetical protein [Aurantiacibacter sp. MUD11]WAT16961.1 hypothetical protein OZN62_08405 [Aurantiacibacter sp. MUD11]